MRLARLVAGLALLAALAGCTGLLAGQAGEKPGWVETPEVVGEQGKFLTAQGQAGPGLPDEVQRQADDAARTQLAAVLSEYAETTARAFLISRAAADSPLAQQFTRTLATEVSTDILRSAMSRDSWEEADGVTHVLYRVPMALVNDKIVEKTPESVVTANPFGEESAEAAAQMEQFLQGRLVERLKVAAHTSPPAPLPRVGPSTPAWLEADRRAGYPSDKFLSAIGLGADDRGAADSARASLAGAIDVRLQGQVRALLAEPSHGPMNDNIEHLGPGSLHFTDKDLLATRIAERWHDTVTDTYYALAALDRAGASLLYRQRLADALDKQREMSASAEKNRKANAYAAALVDQLDALVAATDAFHMQLAALAAAPDGEAAELRGLVTDPVIAQAKAGLAALLEQIELTRVSGDDQWVSPGGAPRAPLAVRVTAGAGRVPLPGVPVQMSVAGPRTSRGTPSQCKTDEAGTARCTLAGPLPFTPRQGTVTAALDLGQLAAGADLSGLKAPQTEFRYALRSRDNTIVAVYLYDVASSGGAAPVAAVLRPALAGAGFRLVDDARVLENVRVGKPTADAPPAAAIDARGLRQSVQPTDALLIVVGRLRIRLVDSVKVTGGTMKIVYCDYNVALIDAEDADQLRTVMVAEGSGQGAYTDDEVEAGTRATADAASALSKKLLGELTTRFGPPRGTP